MGGQGFTDSTNVYVPTMFLEHLVSVDESVLDTLSFGCYDIIFRVALTLPYRLLGCVVS